jgi:hypothetical protein
MKREVVFSRFEQITDTHALVQTVSYTYIETMMPPPNFVERYVAVRPGS